LSAGYCPERVIVPAIKSFGETRFEDFNGVMRDITIGYCHLNSGNFPVDLISPRMEVSSRQLLLERMHAPNVRYNGGDFSVLSSLGATYINGVSGQVDQTWFDTTTLYVPSKWFSTGSKMVLRAYPNAVRCRETIRYEEGSVVVNGRTVVKDVSCPWMDVQEWKPIKRSNWYDDELQFNLSLGFFKSGDTTVAYTKGSRVPMVKQAIEKIVFPCSSVTYCVPRVEVEMKCRNLATKITQEGSTRLYEFPNVDYAMSFYNANKQFSKNRLWYGDIGAGVDMVDPMNSNYRLVVPDVALLYVNLYITPVRHMELAYNSKDYDKVGNYFFETTGSNVFEAFDMYDGMRDEKGWDYEDDDVGSSRDLVDAH